MPRLLLTLVLLVSLAPAAGAQKLSSKERAIARRISSQQGADLALLERVVNINSGTLNLEGVRAVGQVFGEEFRRLGFTVRWVALPDSLHRAGHLFAERKGRKGKGRRLLLLGHLDTVFEPDSPFQKFERQDTLVRGPGVNDMKGAIVMMISALKALQAEGALDGATITVALMGDEEDTGEPASVARAALVDAASRSDVVLGFEGSTYTEAVVARRGFTSWRLAAHGKQAHSQGVFRGGNGAIYELARILDGFYREVRGEPNLSFNPGVILGGTEVSFDTVALTGTTAGKLNIIAPEAVAAGDLRFISGDQEQRAREAMQKLVEQHLPGTSAELTFYGSSPAMEPKAGNYALLRELDAVSRELGSGPVEAQDPGTRGAGDISYIAAQADALDGLGTLGGGDHSPDEYMNLKAMPVLTQRAAILIYRLTHRRAGR
ncbi:MAG TPA: M20/M25/M40 family metallo-hydrolase [Gemmatimonadales bacterium]|nr:M20/M25/M40 family metallo-hydrolase [Gemmatimonadales bacterium]